ncbi:MAG: LPXTG cell wall anchor domain-containing protein [Nakamurella sp.]
MTSTQQRARGGSRPGRADGARRRRRWGSRLGDVLLTLASVGGVICILAVIAAVLFKVSLIMFSTGSMAPTIPAGSVAVVRQIPAAEVAAGDVVTVDRPGQLPVTHRVRAVEPGQGDVRVLTLRGDANAQDDAVTYPVSTVRIVLFSVPKLAAVIVSLADPFVLGGITVVMATVVMWAFWPRRRPERSDEAGPSADAEPAGDAEHLNGTDQLNGTEPLGGSEPLREAGPAVAQDEQTGAATAAGRHRAVTTTGAAAVGLLFLFGAVAGAPDARAATVERVVQGSVLRLTTIGDDAAMTRMQPGVPVVWQVGVTTRTLEPGTIDLALRVSGPLATSPSGLQLRVSACDSRWVAGRCLADERTVIVAGPAERYTSRSYEVGSMSADQQRWLLVTAWLPEGSIAQGRSATVTVAASGIGETVAAQPGAPGPAVPLPPVVGSPSDPGVFLPNTGVGAGVRLALFAGLVALAAGLVLLGATRRRSRETSCAA